MPCGVLVVPSWSQSFIREYDVKEMAVKLFINLSQPPTQRLVRLLSLAFPGPLVLLLCSPVAYGFYSLAFLDSRCCQLLLPAFCCLHFGLGFQHIIISSLFVFNLAASVCLVFRYLFAETIYSSKLKAKLAQLGKPIRVRDELA